MSEVADAAFFEACRSRVAAADPIAVDGRVRSAVGVLLEAEGVRARVGSICSVEPDGGEAFAAEVIGFRDRRFLLMPLGEQGGVGPGARIRVVRGRATVSVSDDCLGRVLNGLGAPIDGGAPIEGEEVPLYRRVQPSLSRRRLARPLDVGVRAINGLLTLAQGSRMGIFSGSGIGKSTLLGQIARQTDADVNVLALVGERGREVREFVESELGDALSRSVVVVSTSDEAPLLRVRAAHVAMSIAESFRREGRHVLLLMDSLTRFCTAQREIGLAAGEPPATRGFPPSVWSALPRLLERAGTASGSGSITGIFTVLVEGDDHNEPVADAARALLDGHIVLSRELAQRGHFPPIDVLASVSRVMPAVVDERHARLVRSAREALAAYQRAADLISIGAYREGSDPAVDRARQLKAPRLFQRRQGYTGVLGLVPQPGDQPLVDRRAKERHVVMTCDVLLSPRWS